MSASLGDVNQQNTVLANLTLPIKTILHTVWHVLDIQYDIVFSNGNSGNSISTGMIPMIPLLKEVDRYSELIPIASTISGVLSIALKYLGEYMNPAGNSEPSDLDYFRRKSFSRCLFSAVPFIGNIYVIYYERSPDVYDENDEQELKDIALCRKSDKEYLLKTIEQNPWAMRNASNELKNSKEFMHEVIKLNPWALNCASKELRNDKEILLQAIQLDGESLDCASDELKRNNEFVLDAVKLNGEALQYADDLLKSDLKVGAAAIISHPPALQFIPQDLRIRAINEAWKGNLIDKAGFFKSLQLIDTALFRWLSREVQQGNLHAIGCCFDNQPNRLTNIHFHFQ